MNLQVPDRPRYTALWYFVGQYKLIYSGILVVVVFSAILESLSVAAFFPVFVSVLGDSSRDENGVLKFMAWIVNLVPIESKIAASSVALLAIFVSKALFGFLRDVLIGWTGAKVLYNIRKEVMDRHANARYQYHLENKQGTLLYNSIEAPNAVGILLFTGTQAVVSILKILSITLVLFFIFPLAALALVGAGLLYYAFVHMLSNKISYDIARGQARAGAEQMSTINEFLSGFRQIIAFGTTNWWVSRFDRVNMTMRDLNVRELIWTAVPRPVMEIFGISLILGLISILWITGEGTIADSLPTVGVFAVALMQLMPPLSAIGGQRIRLMAALPNAEIAYYTITGPIPMRQDGPRSMESFQNDISFADVSFTHRNRDQLFDRINLTFPKGKISAIVGPSGVGKTTIINLMLGIFDPVGGSIDIDGIPLNEFKQDGWLSKIGFVSQDPFIYNSTITDNILFGREHHSMESVVKAATIANAHGFINELPMGYDTIVGDRGMMLSGGQQQRVAIARAMLEAPEILIFDEATSSLDTISERLVQEAIDNVSVNRTVIIIAHRLSTIRHADKIIIIDNGQVVEEGTHEDLLKLGGHYSSLTAAST